MDIGSLTIGLGGLAVAALSLYLGHRERNAHYRHALYDRQVEALQELHRSLGKLHWAATALIAAHDWKLDDSTRPLLRSDLLVPLQGLAAVEQSWSLVLPASVQEAVSGYRRVFNAVSAPASVADQHDRELVWHDDPALPLAHEWQKVVSAARRAIGTDALSTETLKLVGTPPPEQADGVKSTKG